MSEPGWIDRKLAAPPPAEAARLDSDPGEDELKAKIASARLLALLGENEELRRATGRFPVAGRGLRILAIDGGAPLAGRAWPLLLASASPLRRRPPQLFFLNSLPRFRFTLCRWNERVGVVQAIGSLGRGLLKIQKNIQL